MNVTTYITLDINYGTLETELGGHIVTPSSQSFEYGDVIKFYCSYGWGESVRGWHVFNVADSRFHRSDYSLQMYFVSGNQWTQEMELVMNYNNDVIVICELT